MVIVFALLAALSNAVNEATQHVASIAAPRRSSGWRRGRPVRGAGGASRRASAVSQPFLVIIDPIVSIALGVWLFDQHFTSSGTVLAMAAIAFAVMCAGVVLLTQTAPATMKADIHTDKGGVGRPMQQVPATGVGDGHGA